MEDAGVALEVSGRWYRASRDGRQCGLRRLPGWYRPCRARRMIELHRHAMLVLVPATQGCSLAVLLSIR